MFLDRLEEKEKEVFLDLAIQTSKTNGMVEEKEKEMIKQYCREMEISEYTIYDSKTAEEAAVFFKDLEEWKKKIVLIELIGLGIADGKYDKKEREFIDFLADKMMISKNCIDLLEEAVKDYQIIVEKMSVVVFS